MNNNINMEFIEGIKKMYKYSLNSNDKNNYSKFYEDLYINKLFNNCDDKILSINEYYNLYQNINDKDIKKLVKKLFNINNCVIVYRSNKTII